MLQLRLLVTKVPKTLFTELKRAPCNKRYLHFVPLTKTRLSNPTSLLKCQESLKFRIRVFARPFVATPQIPEKKEKKQKKLLRENIYTIPNLLTVGRLIAAPYVGYLIVNHDYPLALGVFVLAGLTDMLDGFIARRYNLKTIVGSIIDPMADKALMTVLTVTLAMQNLIPMPLAYVILGRDAGLVIAAFYYRYISLPKPKTLVRYFDFSIPSAEVRPTNISKINTLLQLVLMTGTLTTATFGQPSPEVLTALQWAVGGTTIWSGASYIYSKDAVRILNQAK
ncbi:CDP-alcohol phosphatidyltransferase-domain-containing protein [Pilaira anomala]|nr:CDP-alcohol phosphatidyltransferase-domain-containing protein [Pilaira anomala]